MNLWIASVLGWAILSTTALAQSPNPYPQGSNAPASILYDNFNEKFLDPEKWSPISGCHAGNGHELECVRTIQNGQLLMAHRTFGDRSSNNGFQIGFVSVRFATIAAIKSITADLVVHDVEEIPCAANQGIGGSAEITGTFFNAGSGRTSDDVTAYFSFGRVASDPAGRLTGVGQIAQGNNFFGFFLLGTVPMGTPLTMTLTWDQPNHQFIVTWIDHRTDTTTRVPMPYSVSDTTAPANPSKFLSAGTFPANCTANPTSGYVKATFDNVYIQ